MPILSIHPAAPNLSSTPTSLPLQLLHPLLPFRFITFAYAKITFPDMSISVKVTTKATINDCMKSFIVPPRCLNRT